MNKNFIERTNFLKIYSYNKQYKKEDRRHRRALRFQILIAIVCVIITILDYKYNSNFMHNLYLDQFNRIYALLVALLTAILVGITPLDSNSNLKKRQNDYTSITYKQDYVSVLMYTLMLYMIGIATNVFYAMFLQYFQLPIIDISFWTIHLFLIFNALFFTCYCVDELADIVKNSM